MVRLQNSAGVRRPHVEAELVQAFDHDLRVLAPERALRASPRLGQGGENQGAVGDAFRSGTVISARTGWSSGTISMSRGRGIASLRGMRRVAGYTKHRGVVWRFQKTGMDGTILPVQGGLKFFEFGYERRQRRGPGFCGWPGRCPATSRASRRRCGWCPETGGAEGGPGWDAAAATPGRPARRRQHGANDSSGSPARRARRAAAAGCAPPALSKNLPRPHRRAVGIFSSGVTTQTALTNRSARAASTPVFSAPAMGGRPQSARPALAASFPGRAPLGLDAADIRDNRARLEGGQQPGGDGRHPGERGAEDDEVGSGDGRQQVRGGIVQRAGALAIGEAGGAADEPGDFPGQPALLDRQADGTAQQPDADDRNFPKVHARRIAGRARKGQRVERQPGWTTGGTEKSKFNPKNPRKFQNSSLKEIPAIAKDMADKSNSKIHIRLDRAGKPGNLQWPDTGCAMNASPPDMVWPLPDL